MAKGKRHSTSLFKLQLDPCTPSPAAIARLEPTESIWNILRQRVRKEAGGLLRMRQCYKEWNKITMQEVRARIAESQSDVKG